MSEQNGFRAIDRVRQGFQRDVRWLEVPEWGGLKLGFGTVTYADVQAVKGMTSGDGAQSDFDVSLRLLVSKALDEGLKPAFSPGDIEYLRREADYEVLLRVIAFMYNRIPSRAEAEKEVGETPASASA